MLLLFICCSATAVYAADTNGKTENTQSSDVLVETQDQKTAKIKGEPAGHGLSASETKALDEQEVEEVEAFLDEIARENEKRASARMVPVNYQGFYYAPDMDKSQGTESILAELSKEAAGKVYYKLKEGGDAQLASKIAVVDAVPLSDFKRDTEFGRVVAEYLLTDLADRGLSVTELRLGKEIHILPQVGEFIMTRNIGELANMYPELDYVVISTYSNTRKTLILQGRLVNLKTGEVKASWRHTLPVNRELLGLFQTVNRKPVTIAVKGMM
ncbi:MAG: hypothetical protein KKE17_12325 [Proteobacteria bacterium]|nr:hypothetical protein [Pseudomonadota bacterium]MBU1710784.1 hypothetical protein [Pseudomonadota bacterium]